ncbi:MAG TPA: c-type cytochrome [Isosphaeraceae bacterium]|nr:c-type cytochrome [Isosphaeraceae bacterium]
MILARRPRTVLLTLLTLLAPALSLRGGPVSESEVLADEPKLPGNAQPAWIWLGDSAKPDQTVYFRKEIALGGAVTSAKLYVSCDNEATLLLDGRPLLKVTGWERPAFADVMNAFRGRGRPQGAAGQHVLAAKCRNEDGPAGLLVVLVVESRGKEPVAIVSDASWKASEREEAGWETADFKAESWASCKIVAKLGDAPWSVVNAASLAAAARMREPTATAPETLKVPKGFRVELLYTVPKETQGSWVNLTADPKGRLIVSDQYGKLYRVTPPPIGGQASAIQIEPIDVQIGEAQGLTWAFDSLYVVVNRGAKYPSGLYRVRDTDGDDRLDRVEPLRLLDGGGEHGPHAVIPGPDGNSLYVIAGNATKLTELAGSLVPRLWDEDQILPYLLDGNGFMRDERAPGGAVYRVDPDGKSLVLVSTGYRNPYDLAFNRQGDLFTYDSDMEWDMNTPWYRPTRVCQAVSGSDFGYRNGSGKWPPYYPDSLPAVVNIGPGSPTGVAFGYGAKFPSKYQDAFYICDWSYGKLYAVHLMPESSTYKASLEEFISGRPLPLTDIIVNPHDRAMYFTIGGRRTLSGLYRVTYTGDESTESLRSNETGAESRALRRKLEAFHGHKDPAAVEVAWPNLGHPDRFIRYAARVAIEHQDPATWQEKALAPQASEASLTALLALTRAGDKALQSRLLEALDRLKWSELTFAQQLALIRVYDLAFVRMGAPDTATAARVIGRFDTLFPSKSRELNAELCKLSVYLQAPDTAAKGMALLAHAPTQEEQMEYAMALRKLKAGWTPELRKAYFSWFLKAANFKGGASLAGFLREIKTDAVASLSPQEKAELKPILDARPASPTAAAPIAPRPFVKAWTVDELAPLVERGLSGRDFDRGRSLFAAANCFSCHRFANEGGTLGPDLTGVAGRFSPRDLLESIVQPSKSISDQYGALNIALLDGRVVTGRIVNLHEDIMSINTNMLDPNALVNVDRKQVEQMAPSPISMMPESLLNTLDKEEVLDLMAYLLSGGDRENAIFGAGAKRTK